MAPLSVYVDQKTLVFPDLMDENWNTLNLVILRTFPKAASMYKL